MSKKPIYKFESLKDLLRRRGYEVGEAKPYKKIEGAVITWATASTTTFLPDGGVSYIDEHGYEHIGFLYKKDYRMDTYPDGPRMHTRQCQVINDFKQSGGFHHYRFAETRTVIVSDMDNGYRDIKVTNLKHCGYCSKIILGENHFSGIQGSQDFERLVEESKALEKYRVARHAKEQEVDIFGYTKDWKSISDAYREKKDYTCESCGLKIDNPFDRRYIQVHHANGDKLNNSESNLRCLCLFCHAHVDDHHHKRLTTGANKVEYDEFVKMYGKRNK